MEAFGVRVALVDVRHSLEGRNALPSLDGVTLARLSRFPGTEQVNESSLLAALGPVPVVRTVRPLAQLVPPDYPTLDRLARRARGIHRWGVLRMDVDDLGELFRQDLTLSRLATLSLSLRLFFEGWLPTLAGPQEEDADDLSQGLYLQYAGGDDLFLVGAWDALPRFAERVRRSFADYVAHNPRITLSGGITLADAKYPLYQAAREADEAEKDAKRLPGKNAITFLGRTLSWELFGEARQRADALADWCENRGAPRSLLQTLLEIAAEYERNRKQNRKQGQRLHLGRWTWVAFYQLTRAAAGVKDKEVKEGIIALRDEFLTSATLVQTIGLAARWAELLTRRGEVNNERGE